MSLFSFEEDPILDRVPNCHKCNSFNISTDIRTNKKVCSNCGNSDLFASINMEEVKEASIAREEKNLSEEEKRGIKRITNDNDYIL